MSGSSALVVKEASIAAAAVLEKRLHTRFPNIGAHRAASTVDANDRESTLQTQRLILAVNSDIGSDRPQVRSRRIPDGIDGREGEMSDTKMGGSEKTRLARSLLALMYIWGVVR